ncbi:SemiSWEET family transporter [Eupransor demetentiae]|uniref:SemiSWEET family n=1 Tax=Eupransor demetentiae TaxID=3109584 RepID=A0ABM9N4A9_9LACO|nr:SemiSWEET family [Lactobacillaceae bacterium LMG 33000]
MTKSVDWNKFIKYVSWVATVLAVLMYVSYIPQIQANLAGHKGEPLQPLVAAMNCTLWVFYALFKEHRDYAVAAANLPGIFFGIVAFATAI